jgi:cytochrome d ubiquinol oxidase subunit II
VETLWFIIVAFMLTMYVILDGFDLGAGIIHLLIAKTEEERRTILNAIGPVWDGNEVWLVAAGGTLYCAFPLVYASGFSGFYLPLMIVLWLLMARASGIELRHQINHGLWTSFWDIVFSASSILLAVFFGAALGNIIRGVPLSREGYFFEPLWTSFTVAPEAGVLDWFTLMMGLVALATLTSHGARFIALKTAGTVRERARMLAGKAWWGVLASSLAALVAAVMIRPGLTVNYEAHPWGYLFLLGGAGGLLGMKATGARGDDRMAFICSSVSIGSMMAATAFGLFPDLLPSSGDSTFALTAYNAAAHEYGLRAGLIWWTIGILLAAGYLIHVYRSFRGTVTLSDDGY